MTPKLTQIFALTRSGWHNSNGVTQMGGARRTTLLPRFASQCRPEEGGGSQPTIMTLPMTLSHGGGPLGWLSVFSRLLPQIFCRRARAWGTKFLSMAWEASTTLADLLTPLLAANPFSTMRASLRRESSEEFENGAARGGRSGPGRGPGDG